MEAKNGRGRGAGNLFFHCFHHITNLHVCFLSFPIAHFSCRLDNIKNKIEEKDALILREKLKRRADVARAVDKRKAMEKTLEDLHEWVDELHGELLHAKASARTSAKLLKSEKTKVAKLNTVAVRRLELLKNMKDRLDTVKSDLVEESQQRAALERMRTIQLEIKKERPVGRRGGAKRWPVHIVLLICEMLVNGTNPTAVPANIQTSCAAFTGVEAEELPSVNFVRECRVVLQNLNETLSAFRLGNATSWHQAFTDGTTRRQIAFQNLVIALLEDGDLDPVIVSSCMYVENETSEQCVQSIIETVSQTHVLFLMLKSNVCSHK